MKILAGSERVTPRSSPMKRILSCTLLLPLAVATFSCAVAYAAPPIDITIAPPPPRVVEAPPPRPGFIWAPGYWQWDGRHHAWIDGHWVRERHGRHWVPAHWDERHGHYFFVEGHWER